LWGTWQHLWWNFPLLCYDAIEAPRVWSNDDRYISKASLLSYPLLWCHRCSKCMIKWWSTYLWGLSSLLSSVLCLDHCLMFTGLFWGGGLWSTCLPVLITVVVLLLLVLPLLVLVLVLVILVLLLILLYFLHLLEQGTECHEHQRLHPDAPWMMSSHPMESKN
jgi:hypothetical protein